MIVIKILNAILTPIIALIALYIAYQQYLSNRKTAEKQNLLETKKINFELYKKRFLIFDETKKTLKKIMEQSGVEMKELEDFSTNVKESCFLFEKDIVDFLNEMEKKNIDLLHFKNDLAYLSQKKESNEYQSLVKQKWELENWFLNSHKNIEDRFIKYLDFREL